MIDFGAAVTPSSSNRKGWAGFKDGSFHLGVATWFLHRFKEENSFPALAVAHLRAADAETNVASLPGAHKSLERF